MSLKKILEGANKGFTSLGAATSPGVKKAGTRSGGGSKYYSRDKTSGQVKSESQKKLNKRGKFVAGGTGLAAGAGVLAATGSNRSDRSKKLDSTIADMKVKRAEAKKAREDKEAARKKKNAATKEANAKKRKAPKGGTSPGIMTKDSGTTKNTPKRTAPKGGTAPGIMTKDSGTTKKKVVKTKVSDKSTDKTNKDKTNKDKTPKKVGGLRKFLLGKDGKFGGARGAIDFLPGKSRKKKGSSTSDSSKSSSPKATVTGRDSGVRKDGGRNVGSGDTLRANVTKEQLQRTGLTLNKYLNFMDDNNGKRPPNALMLSKVKNGGMMKSKGMSKGGAMKSKGMSKGGAMKSKGMSKGGAMKKKGYAMGGAVRSKMASKGGKRGGASSKPRGVGAATRGYGKAMR